MCCEILPRRERKMGEARILLLAQGSCASIPEVAARLRESGYETTTLFDANEAWRLLAKQPYDVVAIEVSGDRIEEGWLVCRLLRRRSGSPIIILGLSHDKEAALNYYRAGADVYLAIPFEMQEFFARLYGLFQWERRRAKASTSSVSMAGLETG